MIPNSDSLVYEKLQKGAVKNRKINILPEPETPMDLGQKVEDKPVIYLDSIDEILANIEYQEEDIADNNLAETEELVMPNVIKSSMGVDTEEEKQKIEIPGTGLNVVKSSDNRYKVAEIKVVSKSHHKIEAHFTHKMKKFHCIKT